MAADQPAAIKKIRATGRHARAHGRLLPGAGRGRAHRQRQDRLVHERRSGRAAALLRLPGLLSREPRRRARLLAHGRRPDPGRQRRRLLARHLLLPDQRRRLLPAQADAADQGLRHGGRAEAGRPGLQHQPVPRREGLARLLPARVRRAAASASTPCAASATSPRDHLDGPDRPAQGADPDPRGGLRAASSTSTACKEVVASSYRCTLLWKKVLRLAEHRPSPITFFDGTIHMGPAVVLRGDRARRGVLRDPDRRAGGAHRRAASAPSTTRRYRFYWEGMPVWGKLREPRRAVRRARAPASSPPPTATAGSSRPWAATIPSRAWRAPTPSCSSSARRSSRSSTSRAWSATTASTASSTTTRRPVPTTPTTATACPSGWSRKLGIPYVVINGDLNDLRLYSEEQARTQFEALVEQLQESS